MEGPLRFCMVTTFYPPYSFGGDGLFVQRLSNELASRGHRVDVVHCVDSYRALAGTEPATTQTAHPNVRVHSLESPFRFLSPLATQQSGLPLFKSGAIREILSGPFDVIHYHNISLIGGPAVLRYGSAIKLYTTHEYWLVCPTHLLFRFNRAPCSAPLCSLCSLTYKRPPQWWRYTGLLESALKHVDAFISPSRFSAETHRRMGLDLPFVHLPSFVPRAPACDSESGAAGGQKPASLDFQEPYFLFAGRLEKIKGLHTLLPIFQNSSKAKLVIAGSGSWELRLREMAAGSPNIRFMGQLSEPEMQRLYRDAVAVIVPSLVFEIFPLVMIEAFRQKTPVIARKLGGMAEIVEESGGGLAYESTDELIGAMHRLLTDVPLRNGLGLRGFEAYERNWTAEVHLERYLELVKSIARSARRSGHR